MKQEWKNINLINVNFLLHYSYIKRTSSIVKAGRIIIQLMISVRKQLTFCDDNAGFPAKWHLTNEHQNSILMMLYYPDLRSASDWSGRVGRVFFSQSEASSVWNFCAGFLEIISQGNQWWHHKMSAVFLGYQMISKGYKVNALIFDQFLPTNL